MQLQAHQEYRTHFPKTETVSRLRLAVVDPVVVERYWSHIKTGRSDECWLWIGAISGKGHGRFQIAADQRVEGTRHTYVVIAHRYGYAALHGVDKLLEVPLISHKCDKPPGLPAVSSAARCAAFATASMTTIVIPAGYSAANRAKESAVEDYEPGMTIRSVTADEIQDIAARAHRVTYYRPGDVPGGWYSDTFAPEQPVLVRVLSRDESARHDDAARHYARGDVLGFRFASGGLPECYTIPLSMVREWRQISEAEAFQVLPTLGIPYVLVQEIEQMIAG